MRVLAPLFALVLFTEQTASAALVVVITGKQAEPSTAERLGTLLQSAWEQLLGLLS